MIRKLKILKGKLEHYNSKSKPLGKLAIGTEVWVKDTIKGKWQRMGTVIGLGNYHNYHIKSPCGRTYWRNRRHIRHNVEP